MKRLFLCLLVVASSITPGVAAESEAPAEAPRVEIATSKGTIVVELFPDEAPKTVENFLGYVERGFYDGTVFHRVMRNFMIQGGGFTPDLTLKTPGPLLENEADNGLSNKRGTIAMARRNPAHTATCQFYINHVDNPALDHVDKSSDRAWGYAVFGRVVAGMDVVDAIAEARTHTRRDKGMANVPVEPVMIDGVIWVNAPSPTGMDVAAE